MSRITFHSMRGRAAVRGAERHYLSSLAEGAAIGAFCLTDPFADHWIFKSIRPRAEAHPMPFFAAHLRHGQDVRLTMPDGTEHGVLDVLLNTAIRIGGPPMQLAAKLHGFCEGHCFVEGPDRRWLAEVICGGLHLGILRRDMGWEGVSTLLSAFDDEPVACSFSVSDSFPHRPEGYDRDAWHEAPEEDRWRIAMADVRRCPWLRLCPETLDEPTFSEGLTLFDLEAAWTSKATDDDRKEGLFVETPDGPPIVDPADRDPPACACGEHRAGRCPDEGGRAT